MNETSSPQEDQTLGTAPIVEGGTTTETLVSSTREARPGMEKTSDSARKLTNKASTMASEYATAGKDKASDALENLARLMRDAAKTVDERLGENYGRYARKTADAIENAAGSLRERDFSDMADDTREFVRRSPVMAVGAAAAVGFVLARLLRSGSNNATRS